jgi:hypothetical protein
MEKTRMKEHLFDKRVVHRALQEGLLKEEDYQRMLDALPDLSDKLQTSGIGVVSARSESDDVDDTDDLIDDDVDDIDGEDDEDDEDLDEAPEETTPNAFSTDV